MSLFSFERPKIKKKPAKSVGFSGWVKCPCGDLVHESDLEKNLECCPKCNHHFRFSAIQRIENLADKGTFTELFSDLLPVDILKFKDTESYADRLKKMRDKSQSKEGVIVGFCQIDGKDAALGVMDFNFMAGSMGSVVGEKLTRLIEYALEKSLPLVLVSASGGARMQESIFSLMQMAKTSAALAKLHEKKIPYISVLTNPTTGGVTASFASLGDIVIAEPQALICFAGPRVVEQVIRQKLPEGAQKSEFLLKHGMIDCIVSRKELKAKIATFISFLTGNDRPPFKRSLHN